MGIFSKFNKSVDTKGLKKDVQDTIENGGGGFEALPDDKYEVCVDKMEAKMSKSEKPMLSITFKVVAGESKNRLIFANQVLSSAFGISKAIELMIGLADSDEGIFFEDYDQFEDLIADVFEKTKNFEYIIEQETNEKGFQSFEVTEVFDAK